MVHQPRVFLGSLRMPKFRIVPGVLQMRLKLSSPPSRQAKQDWHKKTVLFPRVIELQGSGRHFCFMTTLEARWSASRSRWLWREIKEEVQQDVRDATSWDQEYQPAE